MTRTKPVVGDIVVIKRGRQDTPLYWIGKTVKIHKKYVFDDRTVYKTLPFPEEQGGEQYRDINSDEIGRILPAIVNYGRDD